MSKLENINCYFSISDLANQKKKNRFSGLKPNTIYNLIIDYPFSIHFNIEINVGKNGMDITKLLYTIGKSFKQAYKLAEIDEEQSYNHGIGDLMLANIRVNHSKKEITLTVDS